MTWNEILQLAIGSGGLIGIALLFFRSGKLVQKVESLAATMSKMETDLKSDIKGTKDDIKADMKNFKDDIKADMKNFKDDVKADMKDIKMEIKEIKEDIRGINENIHSIDVRLSILEAETILFNCIPDPNVRSEAAKKSWVKKKQRQLEIQEAIK